MKSEIIVNHKDGHQYAGPFRDERLAREWIAVQPNRAQLQAVMRVEIPIPSADQCKRCRSEMKPGIAIQSTLVGSPDLCEIVTLSHGGPGRIVDCVKCPECGYSETKTIEPHIPTDEERAANHKALMKLHAAERFKLMDKGID